MIARCLPIDTNFEIRDTIEFIGKPSTGEDVLQAGVVAGYPDFGHSDWVGAGIWRDVKNPAQSKICIAHGFMGQAEFPVETQE